MLRRAIKSFVSRSLWTQQRNASHIVIATQAVPDALAEDSCRSTGPMEACRSPAAGLRTFPSFLSRSFSSEASAAKQHESEERKFHHAADAELDSLQEAMDALVEDEDIPGSDIEYGQGVLTIRLGPHGTYVYNKQTPNRQIWMSSPVSGPVRYDHVDGRWIYHRDGHELWDRLTKELNQLLGKELDDLKDT